MRAQTPVNGYQHTHTHTQLNRHTRSTSCRVPVLSSTTLAVDAVLQRHRQDKLLPLLYLANKVIAPLILKQQHTHPVTGKETAKNKPARTSNHTDKLWSGPAVVSEGRMDTSQQPAVLMEPGPSVASPICHLLCALDTHMNTQPAEPAHESVISCSSATSTHHRSLPD